MIRGKYGVFRTYSERRDLADPAIYGTTEELLDEGHGSGRAMKCAMGVALGGIRKKKAQGLKPSSLLMLNGPTEVVP